MCNNLPLAGGRRPRYSNLTMSVRPSVVLIKANYNSLPVALWLSDSCYAKQICTVPEEDAFAVMKV